MPYRIGADIGGTFTDLVLVEDQTGRMVVEKVLTTYPDPTGGVLEGVRRLLQTAGRPPAECSGIIHGTTLVTNALIERKGARVALLTTAGHRDALELRSESRYDMYDLFLEMPAPLVPRDRRWGVRERVLADGTVYLPLDEAEVRSLARRCREESIAGVAVAFLHSYRNPAHERRVREILAEEAPEVAVSISAEVQPEIREYERTSTTACNVYVQGLAERYLRRLERELAEGLGLSGPLHIMISSGGTCTVETACRYPIRLLESGPAAGAMAAAHFGQVTGHRDLLALDMGGTTAKACLIEQGQPLVTTEFEVARVYRFKRGSGLPVKIPSVDLIEIGAGGGSIARINRLGLLQVGPESATSDPGPACYGLGGTEPTVTDADLVLGYLDPGFFLGGEMKLNQQAALAALVRLGDRLGLDPVAAAWGVHRVVNEDMAGAARVHAAERGKDPARFALLAFGGAGPVHAYRVAESLGSPTVIVPPAAGVGAALGFLVAPLAFDFARTFYTPLAGLDWAMVQAMYDDMETEAQELLVRSGVTAEQVRLQRRVDLRYHRQGSEVTVPVPGGPLGPESADLVLQAFEADYTRLYGRTNPEAPVEALTWRLVASGPAPQIPAIPVPARRGGDPAAARKGVRAAYFPEAEGFTPTPVYDRARLAPGDVIPGPAIIEERESTLVVGPRGQVTVDRHLNLIMEWLA